MVQSQKSKVHLISKQQAKASRKAMNTLNQANAYLAAQNYEKAVELLIQVLEHDPTNTAIMTNLGGALIRTHRITEAKLVLENALQINPKDINVRINLGAIYQATKDFQGGINNALEAVTLNPTSHMAFNNLGSAFGAVQMHEEALHAYETSLMLKSDYIGAGLNVGQTLSQLGRYQELLKAYESVLRKIPPTEKGLAEVTKFYMSFIYLRFGMLEKGWNYYESGFNRFIPAGASRNPYRTFPFPQWSGQSLKGKKLLLWREQGIGDELAFMTCMPDILTLCEDVTMECTARFQDIFQRSFPNAAFFPENLAPYERNDRYGKSFDFHLPIGSLPLYFRKSIEKFPTQSLKLTTSDEYNILFQGRLPRIDGKQYVGICWRSGLLDPGRNIHYSALSDWKELFLKKDLVFVNLQYGECEDEIVEAEKLFDVQILRWSDLDLKNELDKVFSLIEQLDFVVSAPTAVSSMAGVLRKKNYILSKKNWDMLGASDINYPWFSNSVILEHSLGESAASGLIRLQ